MYGKIIVTITCLTYIIKTYIIYIYIIFIIIIMRKIMFKLHNKNHNKPGWWLTYPSEKCESQMADYVSQYMETYKMFQTTNQ